MMAAAYLQNLHLVNCLYSLSPPQSAVLSTLCLPCASRYLLVSSPGLNEITMQMAGLVLHSTQGLKRKAMNDHL